MLKSRYVIYISVISADSWPLYFRDTKTMSRTTTRKTGHMLTTNMVKRRPQRRGRRNRSHHLRYQGLKVCTPFLSVVCPSSTFLQPFLGTMIQILTQTMGPGRKKRRGPVSLERKYVYPAEEARFLIILMMSKLWPSYQRRMSIKDTMSILTPHSKRKMRLNLFWVTAEMRVVKTILKMCGMIML